MDDLAAHPTRAELAALVAQLTDALSAERAEALADRRRAARVERELRAERDVYRRLVERRAVVDWPCPTLRAMGVEDITPAATR